MWTSDTGHSVTILNNMYKNKIQNNSRTNRRYMNLKPRPIENNTKYFFAHIYEFDRMARLHYSFTFRSAISVFMQLLLTQGRI